MNSRFTKTKITFTLVAIYILLFEFTWVTQNIFPKPSLLLDSFFSLINDYKLLTAYFTTVSILYVVMFLAVIFIELFKLPLLRLTLKYSFLKNIFAPFKYLTYFFFIVSFNLLFSGSLAAEAIFLFLFFLLSLFEEVENSAFSLREEYRTTAESLKCKEAEIFSKIIWKEAQPAIYDKFEKIHLLAWSVILIYEFVGNSNGMGAVFNSVFLYNDFLGIIVLGIIVSITIWAVNLLVGELRAKIIFWE